MVLFNILSENPLLLKCLLIVNFVAFFPYSIYPIVPLIQSNRMPLLILCWPQHSPAPKLSCIRDPAKQTLKERTFFERSLLNVGVLTIPQLELKHKKDVFCLPQYKERGTERQKNSRQAAAWERAATRRTQHECETSTGTVKERNTDAFKNDNKSWQSLSAWFFFLLHDYFCTKKCGGEPNAI